MSVAITEPRKFHASFRIDDELLAELRKTADEEYEGNVSDLIRVILRDYVVQGRARNCVGS